MNKDDEPADRTAPAEPQADALPPPPARRGPLHNPFLVGVLAVVAVALVIFFVALALR